MNEPIMSGDANGDRRKPRLFQIGLRVLFVGIAVLAVAAGGTIAVTMKRLYDRKTAITTIHDVGGTMGFAIGGPEWLRNIVQDDECFYEPQRVSLGPIAKDNPDLDDDILASVSKSLRAFRDLRVLDIRRSTVTDESSPMLTELTSVTHLRLSDTHITDQSIQHIKQMPNLQWLMLANTSLTDDCVADLSEIKTLAGLDIHGTQITHNGISQLTESLPACKISN